MALDRRISTDRPHERHTMTATHTLPECTSITCTEHGTLYTPDAINHRRQLMGLPPLDL